MKWNKYKNKKNGAERNSFPFLRQRYELREIDNTLKSFLIEKIRKK